MIWTGVINSWRIHIFAFDIVLILLKILKTTRNIKGNQRTNLINMGIVLKMIQKYLKSYLLNNHTDSNNTYTEIFKMLNVYIDNIVVEYDGLVFQQTVSI